MIVRALALFATLVLMVSSAAANPRIALVIGNGQYGYVSPLDNPVNDAELMTRTLEGVGFDVTTVTDANQFIMKRGIAEFGRKLREAGPDATALFFYAGHAVQSFGNNYLLPVDSNIQHQADLDLYGVDAGGILRQLFAARVRTSIVILDACRNNPFENLNSFGDAGLAEMDAPTGTFIAYATAPGKVATDGFGDNSPYTAALARHMTEKPQAIEQLFKQVRIEVLEQTGGQQTPWDSSSLTSDFFFMEQTPQTTISVAEQNFWNSVQNSSEANQLELFLQLYPDSSFRDEAEARIAALRSSPSTSSTTVAVAPTPKPEPAPAPAPSTNEDSGDVITFNRPLTQGAPHIVGRSIQQIFSTGTPMFPPFDGIPDELWKGQSCSNCHSWTKDLLCEQGQFYLSAEANRSLTKEHPLGGGFKSVLRQWAGGGCK